MPTNECIPLYRGGVADLTGHTTAAVTGGTFVAISNDLQSTPLLNSTTSGGNIRVATATAGGQAFGVAAYDAASGKKVAIIRKGNTVPMVADGAITAGNLIEVGTAGKAKANASGVVVGKAISTATNGAVVYVEIA
jgi:hypothetical protein